MEIIYIQLVGEGVKELKRRLCERSSTFTFSDDEDADKDLDDRSKTAR